LHDTSLWKGQYFIYFPHNKDIYSFFILIKEILKEILVEQRQRFSSPKHGRGVSIETQLPKVQAAIGPRRLDLEKIADDRYYRNISMPSSIVISSINNNLLTLVTYDIYSTA